MIGRLNKDVMQLLVDRAKALVSSLWGGVTIKSVLYNLSFRDLSMVALTVNGTVPSTEGVVVELALVVFNKSNTVVGFLSYLDDQHVHTVEPGLFLKGVGFRNIMNAIANSVEDASDEEIMEEVDRNAPAKVRKLLIDAIYKKEK